MACSAEQGDHCKGDEAFGEEAHYDLIVWLLMAKDLSVRDILRGMGKMDLYTGCKCQGRAQDSACAADIGHFPRVGKARRRFR